MKEWMIEYSAASGKGKRLENQDNLRVGNMLTRVDTTRDFAASGVLDAGAHQLVCVCDGIGGGFMGDCAAMVALKAIDETAGAPNAVHGDLDRLVTDAAEAAHYAVSSFLRRMGRSGGCTLTLVGISEGRFVCLNIGDSPCFLLREGQQLRELSVRHNLYWHKLRMQVEPAPRDAHYLMRFVGKANCSVALMADRVSGTLEPGDRIVLCSDGVTNAIGAEAMTERLRSGADAEKLVLEAAAREGADNCTAVVLKVCGPTE